MISDGRCFQHFRPRRSLSGPTYDWSDAVEYRFRLGHKNGPLHLERIEDCNDDEHALAVAWSMLPLKERQFHLEIWRGDDCIYAGVPAGWPFQLGAVRR